MKTTNELLLIKSYLPIFPGFYGTYFEFNDEENYIEEGKSYDDYKWHYQDYYDQVADHACDYVEEELKDLGFDIEVKFECVSSPREYNFRNDSIDCEFQLTKKTFTKIIAYLRDNKDEFDNYIAYKYTSRSGFISHYSNSGTQWIKDLRHEAMPLDHHMGTVLGFILSNEDDEHQMNMYDYATERSHIDCELTNKDNA